MTSSTSMRGVRIPNNMRVANKATSTATAATAATAAAVAPSSSSSSALMVLAAARHQHQHQHRQLMCRASRLSQSFLSKTALSPSFPHLNAAIHLSKNMATGVVSNGRGRQWLFSPDTSLQRYMRCSLSCRVSASTNEAKTSTSVDASEQSESIDVLAKVDAAAQVSAGYPFKEIESKWQQYWDDNKTFSTGKIDGIDTTKPKFYALDMFPYPSGAGLHVGHPEGYTATDIISRYKRMKGFNVLHPMGWDAFGLPAEQYALQTGTHPEVTTRKNIERFRSQLKSLGFSYDWEREIATTDPKYYKWTQWIFLKLLEMDLAYQAEVPVNWCPALGTVLANEEVIDGKSERGGHPVVRKAMKQWMLRITAYADRLIDDLEGLDWSENVKDMQRNWIGRSEGASMTFTICSSDGKMTENELELYTTRPDTICGATFVVMAPEHELVQQITAESEREAVINYVEAAAKKSDFERTQLQKQKSGVRTGAFALNPATGEPIPILVADYVLGGYGSGAIMAVPAHDERDYEFAQMYGLEIRQVVGSENPSDNCELPYTGAGTLMNSNFASTTGLEIDGMNVSDAKQATIRWLEEKKIGHAKVNYKLRDWLFARQRYWGEPFPVVYSKETNECIGIPEESLPLKLPEMESFQPSGTGESPLANNREWVETVVPGTNTEALRDTNTMPQWAGSCWYYLRFIDPWNEKALIGAESERYWMPVDLYVGGAEHTVLHLLYARFWHKVLYDIGAVSTKEPFQRLVNQGMILGEVEFTGYQVTDGTWISAQEANSRDDLVAVSVAPDAVKDTGNGYVLKENESILLSARAHKMSKSRGNVINPDDIVASFGGDSLRLYEMFMGPLRDTKTWSTRGVEGVYRFLGRTWRLFTVLPLVSSEPSREQMKVLHECIKRVSLETEEMRYNTAIAAMMEYVNAATKWDSRPQKAMEPFILLLSPYAPHIAEELWSRLGHSESLAYQSWPVHDESFLVDLTVKIPVQVNGKMRGLVEVPTGCSEEDVVVAATSLDSVSKHIGGKDIKKRIYVQNKILNLIISK